MEDKKQSEMLEKGQALTDEALDDVTGGESQFDGTFVCKQCGKKKSKTQLSLLPGICKSCKDRYFINSEIVTRP